MQLYKAVELIQPHVVRISTPGVTGSGFLLSNGKKTSICGIATAAHVVNHAHYWEEPVRIDHVSSNNYSVIHREERAIFLDEKRDTAAILFLRGNLPLPTDPLPLAPPGMNLKVGNEIGWLGFPAIPAANLCFFTGVISNWLSSEGAYLVDGVAINGVSGGPAFHLTGSEDPWVHIIGVVSAYVPNRATGEVLPGLSIVRDIVQFHELAPTFSSLEEARTAEPQIDAPPSNLDPKSPDQSPTRKIS